MAGYNLTRFVEDLLSRNESRPPSFTVHLHAEHWTLNNGSKFLYNNQIASLLDDIRAHRIPVDFLDLFDAARVPFYDGCMIVELWDYRPPGRNDPPLDPPEKTRTVLHPTGETLWADICLMNQKNSLQWSDQDALQFEARVLLATCAPLCLHPDPHLTRIANHVLKVSTPTAPVSLKRKAAALDLEEEETEKARKQKIMQFMNPRQNRNTNPSYKTLDAAAKMRGKTLPPVPPPAAPTPMPQPQPQPQQQQQQQQPTHHFVHSNHQPPAPPPQVNQYTQAHSPANSDDSRKSKKMKTDPAQVTFAIRNGSQTPIPHATTQQLMNSSVQRHSHSPSPISQSPRAPPNFPNKLGPEPNRTATPVQQNFTQSPQLPPQAPPQVAHRPPGPANNQPPNAATFQPPIPNTHFLQQPPQPRKIQAKPPLNVPAYTSQQQQQQQQQQQSQQQQQHQMNQAAALHALNQQRLMAQQGQRNGRSTPAPQLPAGRGSPMVPNQRLPSRSPMPGTIPMPQQHQPQQPQQQVHPQYGFPAAGQYNPGQMRPLAPGQPQSQQHLLPNNGQSNPAQMAGDSPQAQQMRYMYQYQSFQGQPQGLPPQYWPGMRLPPGMMPGQHPGMATSAQQMQQQQQLARAAANAKGQQAR